MKTDKCKKTTAAFEFVRFRTDQFHLCGEY